MQMRLQPPEVSFSLCEDAVSGMAHGDFCDSMMLLYLYVVHGGKSEFCRLAEETKRPKGGPRVSEDRELLGNSSPMASGVQRMPWGREYIAIPGVDRILCF